MKYKISSKYECLFDSFSVSKGYKGDKSVYVPEEVIVVGGGLSM